MASTGDVLQDTILVARKRCDQVFQNLEAWCNNSRLKELESPALKFNTELNQLKVKRQGVALKLKELHNSGSDWDETVLLEYAHICSQITRLEDDYEREGPQLEKEALAEASEILDCSMYKWILAQPDTFNSAESTLGTSVSNGHGESAMDKRPAMVTPSDSGRESTSTPENDQGQAISTGQSSEIGPGEKLQVAAGEESEDSARSTIIVRQSSSAQTRDPGRKTLSRKRPRSSMGTEESSKRRQSTHSARGAVTELDDFGAAGPPDMRRQTVEFSSLYCTGKVKFVSTILDCPMQSGKFYIFRCHKHDTWFRRKPWKELRDHIKDEKNRHTEYDERSMIKDFGVEVLNCDAASVHNYNRGISSHLNTLGQNRGKGTQILAQVSSNATSLDRITRPLTDGTLYLIKLPKDKQEYAAMVLPMRGDLSRLGIEGTLSESPLMVSNSYLPQCYRLDDESQELCWAEGYDDGQAQERRRRFPVIVFKDDFPKEGIYRWAFASSLREFDQAAIPIQYAKEVQGRKNRPKKVLTTEDAAPKSAPRYGKEDTLPVLL